MPSKVISGKTYHWIAWVTKKSDANKMANKARKDGYLARITSRMHHDYVNEPRFKVYDIWTAKK